MPVDLSIIASLSKRRGFIFQSSDIYGGLGSVWDYGPLGVELKNNVKRAWWHANVYGKDDIFGMDASILMHPKVWEASGHLQSFADPFVKCQSCLKFYRLDKIWDEIWNSPWFISLKETMSGEQDSMRLHKWAKTEGKKLAPNLSLVKEPEVTISWIADLHYKFKGVDLNFQNFIKMIACSRDGVGKIPCPDCGDALSDKSMSANLMFETYFGPVKESAQKVYFRPETAQGMFVNFSNILFSMHPKLPFGLAQIGKAFRNEITTGSFTFRTREFEQMEIEYFVKPNDANRYYERWIEERFNWYVKLGIKKDNLRTRPHSKEELAHYALACTDIEYNFPFGWNELEGIANRSDFDLRQHSEASANDLRYFDNETNEKFYPFIIEPSGGVDRAVLAFLIDAYRTEKVKGEKRVVLGFGKELAPIKVAVLPLLRNRPEIIKMANAIYDDLRGEYKICYDDTASIGRLYRRQDEIGTLYCITVDVESLSDKKVTVRDRDTMEQERIGVDRLKDYIEERLKKPETRNQ